MRMAHGLMAYGKEKERDGASDAAVYSCSIAVIHPLAYTLLTYPL